MKNSNLTPSGESSPETIGTRPGMQSSSGESTPLQSAPPTLDTLGTIPTPPKSQKVSPPIVNLADVDNAVNMIGALAATKYLKALGVKWRRLELADGTPVFALVFPESSWELTPDVQLKPKNRVGSGPNALGEGG